MSKQLLREFYELCEGGICQDFLTEGEKRRVSEGLVGAGVKIGISSRGLGSVRETREGTTVNEDFQLICFDVVQEPSTAGAFIEPSNPRSSMHMNEDVTKNALQNSREQIILSKIYDLVGL